MGHVNELKRNSNAGNWEEPAPPSIEQEGYKLQRLMSWLSNMRDETIRPHINYQINYPTTLHQESEKYKW